VAKIHDVRHSPAPYFDLEEEFKVQQAVKNLISNRLIESAHDVSDGGLFVTLLESSMPNALGFDISTDEEIRKDAFLFGESQSRIVVSVSPGMQDEFIDKMMSEEVEFSLLGEVTGSTLLIDNDRWGDINEWREIYDDAIGNEMNRDEMSTLLQT